MTDIGEEEENSRSGSSRVDPLPPYGRERNSLVENLIRRNGSRQDCGGVRRTARDRKIFLPSFLRSSDHFLSFFGMNGREHDGGNRWNAPRDPDGCFPKGRGRVSERRESEVANAGRGGRKYYLNWIPRFPVWRRFHADPTESAAFLSVSRESRIDRLARRWRDIKL